jgi:hypothetical protein
MSHANQATDEDMGALENHEFRKIWRLNWLGSLADLANIELQQRWLNQMITNPGWTYVEFVCKYFDDLGWSDGDYEEKFQSGFVTRDEHQCVKDFHLALDQYVAPNGDYDHLAILGDPAWQKIVALGHQSMVALEKLITDPAEKISLLEVTALRTADFTWPK